MKHHFQDFIYGSIDGIVTTFAIVAGGFSMAVANYQASKAQIEYIEMKHKTEEWEIDNLEDQEKQEIRDIYTKKGFKDELLEEIVRIITSRRKVWVDTMMREELGLIEDDKRPLDTAFSTFVGFNVIGLIPLLPFVILFTLGFGVETDAFWYSIGFTACAFFLVGIIKGKIVHKSLIKSGTYTLLIGSVGAFVAYLVGYSLNLSIS